MSRQIVGIVGSRNFPDLDQVDRFVDSLAAKYPDAMIVSGGAQGVDLTAEGRGYSNMLTVRSYRPKKNGRGYVILVTETGRYPTTVRDDENRPLRFPSFRDAAFYRNGLIVSDSTQLVAFHYQGSNGTQDSIDKGRARGIPVHVYAPRG